MSNPLGEPSPLPCPPLGAAWQCRHCRVASFWLSGQGDLCSPSRFSRFTSSMPSAASRCCTISLRTSISSSSSRFVPCLLWCACTCAPHRQSPHVRKSLSTCAHHHRPTVCHAPNPITGRKPRRDTLWVTELRAIHCRRCIAHSARVARLRTLPRYRSHRTCLYASYLAWYSSACPHPNPDTLSVF